MSSSPSVSATSMFSVTEYDETHSQEHHTSSGDESVNAAEMSLNESQKRQREEKREGKKVKKARMETPEKKKGPQSADSVSPADFISVSAHDQYVKLSGRETRLANRYDMDMFPTMALHGLLTLYMPLLVLKEQAYPFLMRLFFANMSICKSSGDIISSVRGKFIKLNEMVLAEIFDFGRTGVKELIWGHRWNQELSVSYRDARSKIMENNPNIPPALFLSKLPALSRLLLHMVQNNLLTNFVRTDLITTTETLVMYHILNHTPIDPAFLMMSCIKKVFSQIDNKRIRFPYGNAFTKIFKFFGVNLDLETFSVPIKPYGAGPYKQYCKWWFDAKTDIYMNEDGRMCKYEDGVPTPIPLLDANPNPNPTGPIAVPPSDPSSSGASNAQLQAIIDVFTKRLEAVEDKLSSVISTVTDGLKDIKSHMANMNNTFTQSVKDLEITRSTEYDEFNGRLEKITFLLDHQHKEAQKGVNEMISNLDTLEKTEGASFNSLIKILNEMIRTYKMDRVHLNIPPSHPNINRLDSSDSDDD